LSLLACCGLEYFSLLTAFPCCLPEIGTTERVVVPSFGSCGLMFSALRETSGVVGLGSDVEKIFVLSSFPLFEIISVPLT
jgi:hypothetical protein